MRAINNLFGKPLARATDSGTVDVTVPESYQGRVVEFVARIEGLQVETDVRSKVVVNERTGTIVMGDNVRISTVALSHGGLSIKVRGQPAVGQAVGAETDERLVEMEEGVTLGDLIKGLNNVGATPQDMIAILQAIRAAGALQAELEII